MPRKRTSVMLDEDLAARAGRLLKLDSTSDVIEHALREFVRRSSLRAMADALGTPANQDTAANASRKRSA